MGLAWQQGPLAPRAVGHFLVPEPLPQRLLYAEPLRRRMRVRFGGEWIADSEDVLLLHEPGHYPVAFFPLADLRSGVLVAEDRTTQHRELGDTAWFTVTAGDRSAARAICLAVTDIEATHRELTGRGCPGEGYPAQVTDRGRDRRLAARRRRQASRLRQLR